MLPIPTTAVADGATGAERRTDLAKFAPASANIFLSVHHLEQFDSAMRRAHAWRILPMIAGKPGTKHVEFNLQRSLVEFLGARSSIKTGELMQAELGIMARSWTHLGSSVWLARVRDPKIIDGWWPASKRRASSRNSPEFFGDATGLIIGIKDNLVVMARRGGPESLLSDTMLLMAGRGGPVLSDDPTYQELFSHLPSRPLAIAYFRDEKKAIGSAFASGLLPPIDQAIVGLYEGGGRIDFAVRAVLATPRDDQPLSNEAVNRLVLLPDTTLLASAISIDSLTAPGRTNSDAPNVWRRLTGFLKNLRASSLGASKRPTSFGTNLIIAWDQDLREKTTTPQIAALAECPDPDRARADVEETIEGLLALLKRIDPNAVDALPAIQRVSHLGVRISFVSLSAYAARSRYAFVRLLGNVEPAWAVVDGWFVLALSRDHVERILDARRGLAPNLSQVADVRALTRYSGHRTTLTVVQADLAAAVLKKWLSDFDAGSPSLLDPSWWQVAIGNSATRRKQLGIGISGRQTSGVVNVTRVYPGMRAFGRIKRGDRVLGIDGQLLDFKDPYNDLRRRWVASDAKPGPTLRIERNGAMLDVVLDVESDLIDERTPPQGPAEAVRELALLARELEFASVSSYATDPQRFSARISLRFAPGK